MRFLVSFALVLAALPLRADVAIQEVTSPTGLKAWLVEDHSIPFTALELRFRGGARLDEPGKKGATNLMVGLLEEGAADQDARAFARAKEDLAAGFSYDLSDDFVSVSARFLTENRDQAVALLRDSLLSPRFDPDALERVRQQVVSGILSDQKNPRDLASKAFREIVYGDHPYAQSESGTLESVSALERTDLLTAHRNALTREGLYVAAVGDITPAELAALMDSLLAELPATGPSLPAPAELNFPGGVHVTEFDTPQSVALFAQPGIDRDDPDFFAAYVLDLILGGGGFESRLMHEVREKRGLTYGIYTYLLDKDGAQMWMGSVSSGNDRIAQAIQVIRDEWQKLLDQGVSEQELADAKTYLTGAYPLRFDGNATIAGILVGMQADNMPIDYIATRNDKVNAVTMQDVQRVAQRLLDPSRLTFVVTGQPQGLAAN
ncbi:pitrilysin family protein [Thalassovita sp.]|uniref:M16 family metallopeptidase n=1 Tax=Thalassovita sp. TaxID=1979401 RepID=UPI0029DE6800|nr:pitrilysin family protein [Thalassovita sp.]